MLLKKTKCVICAVITATTCLFSVHTNFISVNQTASADFEKTASETTAELGFGWNLGNSLDSYSGTTVGSNIGSLSSETAWGNPKATKELIDLVKDSGVETVRVPVTWYEHMDPNTYEIDAGWMARVEEVVDYVLDDGMYCIINVHHDTGEKGWLKANSTNLEQKKRCSPLSGNRSAKISWTMGINFSLKATTRSWTRVPINGICQVLRRFRSPTT